MTSDFDDPMDRDRFPDRPDHPDFWRLSELVNRQDGRATEGKVPIPEIVAEFVDPDSLTYLAINRAGMFVEALRASMGYKPSASDRERFTSALASAIVDGFTLGAAFERVKPSVPNEPEGRHASPQAWRRLRAAIGVAEARDVAADIAAVVGCDPKLVDTALSDMPWDRKKQL